MKKPRLVMLSAVLTIFLAALALQASLNPPVLADDRSLLWPLEERHGISVWVFVSKGRKERDHDSEED